MRRFYLSRAARGRRGPQPSPAHEIKAVRKLRLAPASFELLSRWAPKLPYCRPLEKLAAGVVLTVENATRQGALCLRAKRWLMPEDVRAALIYARRLERKAQLAARFKPQGLYGSPNCIGPWTYRTELTVLGLPVLFQTTVPFDMSQLTVKGAEQLIRRCKTQAQEHTSTLKAAIETARHAFQEKASSVKASALRAQFESFLAIELQFGESLQYLVGEIRSWVKRLELIDREEEQPHSFAKLAVAEYTGAKTKVLCLMVSVPGQKPRVSFRTNYNDPGHAIGTYLKAKKELVRGLRVLVQADAELLPVLQASCYMPKTLRTSVSELEPAWVQHAAQFAKNVLLLKAPLGRTGGKTAPANRNRGVNPASFPNHVQVFTDASVQPSGAGVAAVLFDKITRQPRIIREKRPVSDIHLLEFSAALLGLASAVATQDTRPVALFSDNQGAVAALNMVKSSNKVPPSFRAALLEKPLAAIKALLQRCEVYWVRGHAGCRGNMLADRHAKTAAIA